MKPGESSDDKSTTINPRHLASHISVKTETTDVTSALSPGNRMSKEAKQWLTDNLLGPIVPSGGSVGSDRMRRGLGAMPELEKSRGSERWAESVAKAQASTQSAAFAMR